MTRHLRLALFAAALVTTRVAFAQSNDDAIAALKQRGDDQMHDLHFREALEQYDAALKLGGSAAIQYNRARAFQGLGDYPSALDALEEFVRSASPELRGRVPQLDELIADLRAHVATLLIGSNAPHATVRIRHELVGTTPINVPVRVSVGAALVEVEAPGYRAYSREMTFTNGETHVDLTLESETGPVLPVAPVVQVHDEHGSVVRPVSLVVGAVGLGGIALGAIFGGVAVAKRSDLDTACPSKACDAAGAQTRNDAWTFATLSTIGFVSGAVLVAGGALMYFLAPHGPKHVAVFPAVAPNALGVVGVF